MMADFANYGNNDMGMDRLQVQNYIGIRLGQMSLGELGLLEANWYQESKSGETGQVVSR